MTDDMDQNLGQDEIEQLLQQQASGSGEKPQSDAASAAEPAEQASPEVPEAETGNTSDNLSQDEIEKLLQQGGGGQQQPPQPASDATPEPENPARAASSHHEPDPDVQLLINQAEEALRSVDDPHESEVPGLAPFEFKQLAGTPANTDRASLDLLRDVELEMRVELGRTHMYLEDVLQLRKGSVVPLDKMAGDPVDVYVNGRLVARGEVLVLNENFCVRIAELISGEEIEQRESA